MIQWMRRWGAIFADAGSNWMESQAFIHAAALAFFTVFSMLWMTPAIAGDLAERIDEIERVHFSRPWMESQRLIEDIRADLDGAPVDQRARVALFEARNMMLSGRIERGQEILGQALGMPMALPLRLRALELMVAGYTLQKDFEQAFSYLGQALELRESGDEAPIVHASLMEIAARLHAEVGEYALALEYAAESLEVAHRVDDPRAICIGRVGLALVQRRAGLLEFAARATEELWQQCQRSGDPVLIGSSMIVIGWLANAAGKHHEAMGWLRRAVDHHQRSGGQAAGLTDARLELGRALLRTGEVQAALEHFLAGREAVETAWLWNARELDLLISEAYQRLGRHGEALRYVDLAREATLREVDEDRLRRLAYLQVEFEQQRREAGLDLARQHNRLLEAREENARVQRRTRTLVLGTGSVVLALMIWLLLRFRRDRRRFSRTSRVDGLTGLLNHRHFHQRVAETLSAMQRRGRVCSLVAGDVDLFKRINDLHGHRAGDAVLEYLGGLFLEQFPPPAIVGRIGGEEFAVFLPEHNRLQARQRVEQLRKVVQAVEFADRRIEFTLSFGIAEARGRTGLESLRTAADRALYRAKRAGRNEVVDAADVPEGGTSVPGRPGTAAG